MTGRNDVFQQAMSRGHSAAWDQSWELAAACYREALEEYPEDPKALASLGLALYELQDYEAALQIYSQAATASPNDPLPFEKIAQLAEQTGNRDFLVRAALRAAELYLQKQAVEKAIENLSRVSRVAPENIPAHSRLATIYEHLGRQSQAASEYLATASLLQDNRDTQGAIQAVNRALLISPESREAQQALSALQQGSLLPRPSRSRAATGPLGPASRYKEEQPRPVAQPVTTIDPIRATLDRALAELAGLLFEEPQREQESAGPVTGVAGANRQPHRSNHASIVFHVGQALEIQARGLHSQAVEEFVQAIEAGLDHAAASFNLGFLYSRGEDLESALLYLQYSARHPAYAFGAHLLRAQIYRQLDRLEEAAIEYLEALKLADLQTIPAHQAEALRAQYSLLIQAEAQRVGEGAKALLCDNIDRLLLRNDWQDQLVHLRQDLLETGAGGRPATLGEMLVEARSSRMIESMAKIHQLARQGKLRSAMEEVFYALLYAPNYLPLHVFMGELLVKQDHLQEAIDKFNVVARAYSLRGEAVRAIELFQRIIQIAPMDVAARGCLIEQLLGSGQAEAAVHAYIDLADVYYDLADLEKARHSFGEAFQLARQAGLSPSVKTKILHQMADIEVQRLDWRQAVRIYEQIRNLDPEDARARSNLVELNIRMGQADQAMADLKNYISYLYNRDQQDKAISFVEELVKENPDQMTLQRFLADLHRQSKK